MAKPTTLPFGDFLLQIENPAGSGTFMTPCGFTSKGAQESLSTQETVVPDCDDPDAVAFIERDGDALSMEISASGVIAQENWAIWRAWMRSGASRLVRIYHDVTLANNGGYDQGSFHLTAMNRAGERGRKVTVDITLMSDGEYTWTAATA